MMRLTLPIPVGLLVAWILVGLALGLPDRPTDLFDSRHLALSRDLSLLLLLGSLWAAAGGRLPRLLLWPLAGGLLVLTLLRLADLAAMALAGRPFDPVTDPALLPGLLAVLEAAAPAPVLLMAAGAVLLLLGVISVAAARSLLRGLAAPHGRLLVFAVVGLALAGELAARLTEAPWRPFQPAERGAAAMLRPGGVRSAHAGPPATMAPQPPPGPGQLLGLTVPDVFVVWVESYGMAALRDPRQADRVAARLFALAPALQQAGWSMVSTAVESPVLGGRSALAHGTFRSGVALAARPAEAVVLASGRPSLVAAFRSAGRHTVAVMPGLSRPWPEGRDWGFDTIVGAAETGYVGPAFGWSPVPDQWLLARLDRLLPPDRPRYVEVALTASHAPWTPLPPWLDDVEDAAALAAAPRTADYASMADGYGRSLDYSLRAVGDWLLHRAPGDALVLVLGDHPPVPWISDGAEDRRVPLHILSRDPSLTQPLLSRGFTAGLAPPGDLPAIPMQDLAGRLFGTWTPAPDQGR